MACIGKREEIEQLSALGSNKFSESSEEKRGLMRERV